MAEIWEMLGFLQLAAINGKQPKTQKCNLAKVGVEGSNPFARSSFPR